MPLSPPQLGTNGKKHHRQSLMNSPKSTSGQPANRHQNKRIDMEYLSHTLLYNPKTMRLFLQKFSISTHHPLRANTHPQSTHILHLSQPHTDLLWADPCKNVKKDKNPYMGSQSITSIKILSMFIKTLSPSTITPS